jgi:hypothetical protein
MENITLPPPEQLQQRIADCETELKSLRRLLRVTKAMRDAEEARKRRCQSPPAREAAHGR